QRAQELPKQLVGLPVTLASQTLQVSMRLQQRITELAIRGDDVLAVLQPVADTPDWATFDEDTAPDTATATTSTQTTHRTTGPDQGSSQAAEPFTRDGNSHGVTTLEFDNDPWAEEQRALSHEYADGTFDSTTDTGTDSGPAGPPAGLDHYDELTLPQLRRQLRLFTPEQLAEILAYERAHDNRSSFTGMLSRRIENLRKEQETGPDQDDPDR